MSFLLYSNIVFLNQHHHHGHFLVAKVLKYTGNHKARHRLEQHPHLVCEDFKSQRPFIHYQLEESVDEVWCQRLVSSTFDFFFSYSKLC